MVREGSGGGGGGLEIDVNFVQQTWVLHRSPDVNPLEFEGGLRLHLMSSSITVNPDLTKIQHAYFPCSCFPYLCLSWHMHPDYGINYQLLT